MIKVLIVDDSSTARVALRQALESDSELHVVGEATCEADALQLIRCYDPHIVMVDVCLEHENGFDVTAAIMSTLPRPILVVTSVNAPDPELTYRAVEAGALEVTSKLCGPLLPQYEHERRHLIRLTKTLSAIPVVRHHRRARQTASPSRDQRAAASPAIGLPKGTSSRVVLIGASAGGPATLAEILGQVRAPFRLPIVVVQHISPGFSSGFTSWLSSVTGHRTITVDKPTLLQAGRVYFAQDGKQVAFTTRDYLAPATATTKTHYTPSYDELLQSAANCRVDAISVILTGMGSDGTRGLGALRLWGGTTIAQAPASCIVTSMPQSAIDAQLIDHVLEPGQIALFLQSLQP